MASRHVCLPPCLSMPPCVLPFLRQRLVHPLDLAVLQGGKDLSTWGVKGLVYLHFMLCTERIALKSPERQAEPLSAIVATSAAHVSSMYLLSGFLRHGVRLAFGRGDIKGPSLLRL